MSTTDELKRAVGHAAAASVESGMVLGLGTGSTVRYLLEALGERLARGELERIVGVPTSDETRERARHLGIPVTDLETAPAIDLALDGADEFDPALDLIKGLGGALLREKIVVTASRTFHVLVDSSKRVERLGTRAPLPVEIDQFSLGMQIPFLRGLGCEPRLRVRTSGEPVHTDGGHIILDCHFPGGIEDPAGLAEVLDRRPGVMEHGLFLGCVDRVIVAGADGVEVIDRASAGGGG